MLILNYTPILQLLLSLNLFEKYFLFYIMIRNVTRKGKLKEDLKKHIDYLKNKRVIDKFPIEFLGDVDRYEDGWKQTIKKFTEENSINPVELYKEIKFEEKENEIEKIYKQMNEETKCNRVKKIIDMFKIRKEVNQFLKINEEIVWKAARAKIEKDALDYVYNSN